MDFSIKITGEAGQGLQTIGYLLGKHLTRCGYFVFANQDNESRVRGGHNFFQLRIALRPVSAIKESVDILVPLDNKGIELHLDEISPTGIVLVDDHLENRSQDNRYVSLPLFTAATEIGGSSIYANSAAVGALLGLMRVPLDGLEQLLTELFGAQKAAVNLKVARVLNEMIREQNDISLQPVPPPISRPISRPRLFINGHEALALGALAAGCRFMAAYPMSPSTSIITYLYKVADTMGLVVEQAEDEIAAINMAIGAAYTGIRAMTATSGGGFSLMVEALGLAGMTETPVVAVVAQRPGPATGLPTRTEQGDLNFVIHAAQGEFPRFVLAPGDAEEAFNLTVRAFNLAERFQVPVIILIDQYLGESYMTVEKFDLAQVAIERPGLNISGIATEPYHRYKLTPDGISPRAIPGTPGVAVTLDSDEHDEAGRIIEDALTRRQMMQKRMSRMDAMAEAQRGPKVIGDKDAQWVLYGWGSARGALLEAGEFLRQSGEKVQVCCLSDIWPAAPGLLKHIPPAAQVIVVESNYTGQLARLLAAESGRLFDHRINRYDGRPITPRYIVEGFKRIIEKEE